MISFDQTAEEDEEQIRWTAPIDDAVAEVFELMLGQRCVTIDEGLAGIHSIRAQITFSGALEGHCAVQISTADADRLTDALLGAEGDWDDEMIDDAIGELCNMIAGGWKNRLSAPASVCRLSMPLISRGVAPWKLDTEGTMRRAYTFDGSVLEVMLALI
jgi:chemotaxis protein CheX